MEKCNQHLVIVLLNWNFKTASYFENVFINLSVYLI